MAILVACGFFIQIIFIKTPDVKQGADGHAVPADILGPEKENKQEQEESDDGQSLPAPAFSGIFQNTGIACIYRSAAIQADPVFGIQFLDMAAIGALNFHFCFTLSYPRGACRQVSNKIHDCII
jgi:hypothetical protein